MERDDKGLTIDELLRGIWRHRRAPVLVLAAALAVGGLYLLLRPRVWQAHTVVRVDPQHLGEPYVTPTVTERIEERLAVVRHELLSRPILTQVIEELNLFEDLRESKGLDAAIEALRAALEVKVEGENAFAVAVEAAEPAEAAAIANRLPEVYVDQAREQRAEAAARVAAIFAAELEALRPDVERLETRITQFKATHAGELPEALESNLRQLDRLAGLSESALTALADAQRRRTAMARYGAEGTSEASRLAAALEDSRRELASRKALYTDGHPEVLAAARAHESAKARFDDAVRRARHGDSEAARVEAEIAWLAEATRGYQARMQDFLKRVDQTPATGAELAVLTRDYEAVRAKWQTLLSRKVEAELAQDLERRQKASLFRVIEPAAPPLRPIRPEPVGALGLSLLAGLGLGLALAAWLAARDTSIRSVADARTRLGLPVLAAIPDLSVRRRQRPHEGA